MLLVVALLIVAVLALLVLYVGARRKKTAAEDLCKHYEKVAQSSQERTERLEQELLEHAELAVTDPLTGLYNRRGLMIKESDEEIPRSDRYGDNFSILYIDIDHFKEINDTHGHEVGDMVLVVVADIFRAVTRDGDVLCRNGGDEFIILLPRTGKKRAIKTAERIRRRIAHHTFTTPTEHAFSVTVSIGVATYPPAENFDELLKRADDSMYKAKEDGGNRVATKTPPEEE